MSQLVKLVGRRVLGAAAGAAGRGQSRGCAGRVRPQRWVHVHVEAPAIWPQLQPHGDIVAHHLRDSGHTFYRESMLVLGQSRRYVQAHTCARTHKHPCTHPRIHADAHTPTSHKPKHAHTRAHAQKRAYTRPCTPWWSPLTSNVSMEIDHPAVAT